MNEFIYTSISLSPDICKKIICLYKNIQPYPGHTAGGINSEVKDTLDFNIPVNIKNDSCWYEINKILSEQLYYHLKKYYSIIKNEYGTNLFDTNCIFEHSFMIQKYEQNKGKYVYHNDSAINIDKNKFRVVTFLWYLNDVVEGGETEFFGCYKIKPKCGNILLFPSGWMYPHCGKMPISSDKYIITGWLYKCIEDQIL